MSGWTRTRSFRCNNDCQMSGCPGHVMELTWHGSSDTYHMKIDGESFMHFDEPQLVALTEMFKEPDA